MNEPVLVIPEEPAAEGGETDSEVIRRPLHQLSEWRERLTGNLLRAVLAVGLVVLVAETVLNVQLGRWDLVVLLAGVYLVLAIVTFLRRLPISVRAGALIALFYAVGVLGLSQSGLGGEGRILMLIVPLLALVLIDSRAGAVMMGICTLTLITAGVLMGGGFWVPPIEPRSTEWLPWVTAVAVYLLLAVVTLVPVAYVINNLVANLRQALEEARRRWREVRALSRNLEQQVAERTADLARRSAQLEAAAQVAREAAAIRDVEQLLGETAHLISERFGFYHAGIFLLDKAGEWAVLRAASSEGGQRMLERGHRLRVGEEGIVGYVAATGRPRIAQAVGEEKVFFDNPDLPQTRAEMALPLRVHERLIGVLDIQSRQEGAFIEEDVAILQVMADQLALTIENARLFTETRKALDRLSRYRVEETLKAWREALLRRGVSLSYFYDQTGVRPLPVDEMPVSIDKESQKVTVRSLADGRFLLMAPIRVYGQTIGSLSFEARRAWEPDEIALVEAAVQQMSLALENARLLEETRHYAQRDRLIASITARVRSSMDLETILQTAVRELGVALGSKRTFVQLRSGVPAQSAPTSAGPRRRGTGRLSRLDE